MSRSGIGRAKTRLRKAYVAANLKELPEIESGRAKAKRRRVSARPGVAIREGRFAPDLSRDVGRELLTMFLNTNAGIFDDH